MTYRLFDFAASPFCIKIRALLDYMQIPFERVNIGSPAGMFELRRRSVIGKVPALDMGDGRLICDSTDIAHALEQRHPAPAILPADPRQRALCHVLEDWSDESLYWYGLHYRWLDPAGRREAGTIFKAGGALGRGLISWVVARRARVQARGQGTARKPPEHVAADLERHLDQLEALLADQAYLLGDAPLLCDFALCGQLVYLQRTPHGAAVIARRPTLGAFLERMRALRST
jgi:glutathione S-transferase